MTSGEQVNTIHSLTKMNEWSKLGTRYRTTNGGFWVVWRWWRLIFDRELKRQRAIGARIATNVRIVHPADMPASSAEIIIPVAASLGGALVAGWVSYIAGRGVRLQEWKLQLARERILERQRLYARFIAEADRNLLTVAAGGAKSIDNVMPLFALQAEIWLLSGPSVQEAAKRMCDLALSANAAGTDRAEGDAFAAKTAFVEAARAELAALEEGVRKGKL